MHSTKGKAEWKNTTVGSLWQAVWYCLNKHCAKLKNVYC